MNYVYWAVILTRHSHYITTPLLRIKAKQMLIWQSASGFCVGLKASLIKTKNWHSRTQSVQRQLICQRRNSL
jgi:hypothetical protein